MLNYLSALLGYLAHIELPPFCARILVRWFASHYSISCDDCTAPLDSFPSIGKFFIRELKSSARPIGEGVVSPVDGTLREWGAVRDGVLPQIKGRTYSVASLLSDAEMAASFEGGTFFNLYLSPQDYHCVHAPLDGHVIRSDHIPGKLWPVNNWALEHVRDLFAVNERVVTYLATELGTVAVVMVGATNVGKISVTYDSFTSNSVTNHPSSPVVRRYPSPVTLAKGAKLGTFHLGSSVVVLIPATLSSSLTPLSKVKFGNLLAPMQAIASQERL